MACASCLKNLLTGKLSSHHRIILRESGRNLKSRLSIAHCRPRVPAMVHVGAMVKHCLGIGWYERYAEVGRQQYILPRFDLCPVTAFSGSVGNRQARKGTNGNGKGSVLCGGVVQLVRTPGCHAGGRGFESRGSRQEFSEPDSDISEVVPTG